MTLQNPQNMKIVDKCVFVKHVKKNRKLNLNLLNLNLLLIERKVLFLE